MRLVLIGAALLVVAAAPSTEAQERCSGTLCDLYYGSAATQPDTTTTAKPAATPITVPSTGNLFGGLFGRGASPSQQQAAAPPAAAVPASSEASTSNDYVSLNGGGLLNWNRPSGRCTGTLCDVAYGGSAAEPTGGSAAAATSGNAQTAAASPSAAPRPNVVIPREPERPHCNGGDPWRCYRK